MAEHIVNVHHVSPCEYIVLETRGDNNNVIGGSMLVTIWEHCKHSTDVFVPHSVVHIKKT
jgi:hypothetical protein